jgi:hypothetical protein
MRAILLSIFIVFNLNSFSQEKVWSGDTTYWYNYQKQLNDNLGVEELSKSSFLLAIRITSLNTITDIWTADGKEFFGKQILFTSTYEDNPNKIKYLYENIVIAEDTAQIIRQFVEDYNILRLPPQDSIERWGNGFDGSVYIIEYATPEKYSFNSYWSPTAFPSIPEAVTLSNFLFNIEELLKQKQGFDNFIETLPTDKSYRYGNAWTLIKTYANKKK